MHMPADKNNLSQEPLDPGRQALADALQVSFRLLTGVMVLLAVAYLASGLFIVQEHERAYVLVLGRISGVGAERVKEPGLHWTWPKPVAEIVRVPAARIQHMDIDTHWYEQLPGHEWDPEFGRSVRESLRPLQDGYLLTGDANIVHTRWGLRYTIRDPEAYIFRVREAEQILHKELDRAALSVAQRWPVDRALRTDIEMFRHTVDQELRTRLHTLELGLEVHRLDLLAVTPPLQVAEAFEAVIEAEQDRSRSISSARAYAARVANETQGDTARVQAEASAERQRVVSEAEADADFFTSVLAAFQAQPEVLTQTLWQDRIRDVLARVDRKQILHERAEGQRELRLQLSPPRE